jgi:hypothetical protein
MEIDLGKLAGGLRADHDVLKRHQAAGNLDNVIDVASRSGLYSNDRRRGGGYTRAWGSATRRAACLRTISLAASNHDRQSERGYQNWNTSDDC